MHRRMHQLQQEDHGLTQNSHANALELKSILLSLMSIVQSHGKHITVCNSATAIGCINKFQTSLSELCHHIAKQIWNGQRKKT